MVSFVRKVLITNGLYISITLIYFLAFELVVRPLEGLQSSDFWQLAIALMANVVPLMVFVVLLHRAYLVARYQKPSSPIRALAIDVWHFLSDRNRLLLGVPVMVVMLFFQKIYIEFKVNIPLVSPFSWDEYFYEIDKALHFGVDPWLIVHPFFSLSSYLVWMLNLNYSLWFLFMWATFLIYAFSSSHSVERTRFLLAFFLAWSFGGSLLAILFSSAGPAFFSSLSVGHDPYGPLMRHLAELNLSLPLSAVDLQRMLWDGYANQGTNFGISAMPSMHNAIALLSVLGAWRLNKVAGLALAVHAFLVYVGSFYLGWHYAIDAYLGWIVALAFWWVSSPIARWWHERPEFRPIAVASDED